MEKERLSYAEFKSFLGESKRNSDPLFCRFFLRPLSFPLGWIFYKSGMRANTISCISIGITLVASFLIISAGDEDIILASFFMIFVALLDCVDGNIARARGETGPSGEWMDALSGYTVYAFLPVALGISVQEGSQSDLAAGTWILIGAITSIANLYLRLIYQKYVNSFPEPMTKNEFKGEQSLFAKFSSEMGLVGWMMPALLFASFTNIIYLYMIFYCFFYVISAVAVTIVLFRKVN